MPNWKPYHLLVGMIALIAKVDLKGRIRTLVRMYKSDTEDIVERWTTEGWVPHTNLEWTGIGGASDWENVSVEDAIRYLIGNKAAEPDPFVGLPES